MYNTETLMALVAKIRENDDIGNVWSDEQVITFFIDDLDSGKRKAIVSGRSLGRSGRRYNG